MHHILDADVFVGLSAPNLLDEDDIKKMNDKAIVFAMSNPIPEIMPDVAAKHAAVVKAGPVRPDRVNPPRCRQPS